MTGRRNADRRDDPPTVPFPALVDLDAPTVPLPLVTPTPVRWVIGGGGINPMPVRLVPGPPNGANDPTQRLALIDPPTEPLPPTAPERSPALPVLVRAPPSVALVPTRRRTHERRARRRRALRLAGRAVLAALATLSACVRAAICRAVRAVAAILRRATRYVGPRVRRGLVATRYAGRSSGRRVVRIGPSVVRGTWRIVTHTGTRAVLRWLVSNGAVYPLTGAWVAARRMWEARTNARYERMLRAAESAGDQDRMTDWEHRGEQARERRHQRRMDWLDTPFAIARAVVAVVTTTAGVLAGLGVVLSAAHDDGAWLLVPLRTTADVIASSVAFAAVAWRPALLTTAAIVYLVCWQVGRTSGRVPAWAVPAVRREHAEVIVTPGGIATALDHLGIPTLTRAVKEGWQVEFSTPPVRVNGRGYHAVFTLPMGVTPDMVADRRTVLARNLHRAPLEVWPAAAERAGEVDLWVADQGATEKPAPEFPLVQDGTADVFAGVPCGVSQRGDVIAPELPGANVVFGGMMGQGKSNAARILMAGAALDPLAVLWVFVFANNGDFDAYRPRLARYHRGTDDHIVTAAVASLRALYDEVGRREARLSALGAKKVTRALAERHADLRPTVALFSECHELFGHPDHGKEAADLAVQTMRRARKTAITLAFDTQSARADAIPPKIVELVKINACFAVKSWRSNDGFLGDGSFQSGIRATELRPGKDVGTSVVTGATVERFEIVKWFYLDADDDTGYDAATDLIARAMTTLAPEPAPEPDEHHEAVETRDLLADLDAVLDENRVPAADVPALLREHAPDYEPYRTLSGAGLRERLEREHGIRLPSTKHRYPVDPAVVRERLASRDGGWVGPAGTSPDGAQGPNQGPDGWGATR